MDDPAAVVKAGVLLFWGMLCLILLIGYVVSLTED
jgi:hypothetical protein